ncbi:hypothetical protein [Streptomyces sporangiiformans]|uniref:Uncharacterized protein n=1 Tax=Streptomyces sporangiiformans TaxID=2315329 RepID=A0A505DG35_9ACTN|nr:hypothetical protein [Streptomyces sporangiiformans]TPQ22007.1 hypothetical protein FGD71_012085 [Streptomyces sporangiiformans]
MKVFISYSHPVGDPLDWERSQLWKYHRLLETALRLSSAQTFLEAAREQRATAELTQSLLSSTEEATSLPSATSSMLWSDQAWSSGSVPSETALAAAEEEIQQLWRVTLTLLAKLLGLRTHPPTPHAPSRESSPCGLIKLAAPLIPRAPGEPGVSPGSSIAGALAA